MLEPRPSRGAVRLRAALPHARAFVATSALLLLLGSPLGLLWAQLAPRADVLVEGPQAASLQDPGTSDYIVADLLLLALGAAAGVLCGVLGWRLGRRALAGVALALALGGYAAACVAQEVGERRHQAQVRSVLQEKQPPFEVEAALDVRATSVRFAWPAGALAGLAVAGFLRRPPRREPDHAAAGSWGARP